MAADPRRLFTLEHQPPYHVKRLLPLSLAAFITVPTVAQVSIGNRMGLSISHHETSDNKFIDPVGDGTSPLTGASVALIVESKIKPFIAAQVELGLTQKGRQISEPNLKDYYRMRLNYGEGQFLAKGIVGKGPTKLNILAGISFGRGLVAAELGEFTETDTITVRGLVSGTVDGDTMTFFQDTTFLRTRTYTDRYLPFEKDRKGALALTEWSFVGGLGVSFDLGQSRLFVEGRYVHGLTTIHNGKLDEPDVFNRSILIQFGYLVQLNDPKKNAPAKPEAPQY